MKSLPLIYKTLFSLILFSALFFGCIKKEKVPTPKPVGYFRIDFSEPHYITWDSLLPFSFEYSDIANFNIIKNENQQYWMDLNYPNYNVSLKMSYFPLKNDLRELVLEEEKIINFHIDRRKADDVEFSFVNDDDAHLYGKIYDIAGKGVACPLQFWLTDSSNHYVRASLYFNFSPNNDSLEPIIHYIREDVLQMINTWKWKNE